MGFLSEIGVYLGNSKRRDHDYYGSLTGSHRQPIDQSLSVPMTSSDFERRNANDSFSPSDFLTYAGTV